MHIGVTTNTVHKIDLACINNEIDADVHQRACQSMNRRNMLINKLKQLPTKVFIVCRRHSYACDGRFDKYVDDTRPCPLNMAPFVVDALIRHEDVIRLSPDEQALATQLMANDLLHEWTLADLLTHYRGSIFTNLTDAIRAKQKQPATHVVIMPHEAVRQACTSALTGRIECSAHTLEATMAWAQRLCVEIAAYYDHGILPKPIPFTDDDDRRQHEAATMNTLKRTALCMALSYAASSYPACVQNYVST